MDFLLENALKQAREMYQSEEGLITQARIKVIGVGGGGNNMADWLYRKGVKGAKIIIANTDKVHLSAREADEKILLGKDLTRGLGAGGDPKVGRAAAEESAQEIKNHLKDTDMLFICVGLGGGTGTGAAPVIAKLAKEVNKDMIVIGVATMPFKMEGVRVDKAEDGLQRLRQFCDTVIVIDNNKLIEIAGNRPLREAFAVANELVATMIKGIVETIAIPSYVNLDFADIKAIMKNGGVSIIGIGESASEHRAEEAVQKALTHPLLEVSYEGAKGALIHVTGGNDLTLEEVNKIGEIVRSSLDRDANVIWGARIQEGMDGKIRVMTIITGVKSPFILGPVPEETQREIKQLNEELGIEIIK